MSPYRIAAEQEKQSAEPSDRSADAWPDLDLLPVLVPFWLASVARVTAFVVRHEAVRFDVTLAWVSVLFVPFLLLDSARCAVRKIRAAAARRAARSRSRVS